MTPEEVLAEWDKDNQYGGNATDEGDAVLACKLVVALRKTLKERDELRAKNISLAVEWKHEEGNLKAMAANWHAAYDGAKLQLDIAKRELHVARERYGPGGYKIITEVAALRRVIEAGERWAKPGQFAPEPHEGPCNCSACGLKRELAAYQKEKGWTSGSI